MKNENLYLLIWFVISLFFLTWHECRGISKRQNVQNRPWYWGWDDLGLHLPYGTFRGPILRNPYFSHVSFSRLWGAIDPVALSLNPQLDPVTFQRQLSNDDSNQLETSKIFEGDILLKRVPVPEGMVSSDIHNHLTWPGGRIPYIISNEYNQNDINIIVSAMNSIQDKTCIRFIPRTNEIDYIHIFRANAGCSSYVGRVGGGQAVSLDNGCVTPEVVKHELVHAIGFWHEQSRTDRDDHIIVHFDNIQFEMDNNFHKYDETQVKWLQTPYDIKSIMHYSWNAFAKDGSKPTITAKYGDARIEPSKDLTETDILDINRLYVCNQGDDNSDGFIWHDANYENNVQLKWARGCDFYGNDFREVESSAEDCGGHCVADARCTHFSHGGWGVCYLKTAPKSFKYIPMQGAVCGYMTRRDQEMESTTAKPTQGAFLRNAHGYCLSSEQNANENNIALIQGDCDQPQNGKYWSWDEEISGSSDRHLCNGHKKCVAAPADYNGNIALIQWEHLNENGQRFKFFDLNTTGIFMIKNDHGKCIGIEENSKDIMAKAWVLDCNPSDNGQRWKWQPRNQDSKFITTAICENNENKIACPSKISIVKARYGRYSKDTCMGHNNHLKCDKDVLEIISKLCNGKTNCNLKVTNELMGGDPGYGIHKYLEVQYYCY